MIDNSAWIDWLIGSPNAEGIFERLPQQSEWLLPTMIQLKLAKWLTV